LTKIGVEIHLGHGGRPCPHHNREWEDTDDEGWSTGTHIVRHTGLYHGPAEDIDNAGSDVFAETDHAASNDQDLPEVNATSAARTNVAVVDTSGVHIMSVRFCQCLDSPSHNKQMFGMGMFPASFARSKTAFTFALLNDFTMDNLECGTSATNYYSKIRRVTSSTFPHMVQVSFNITTTERCSDNLGPLPGVDEGG
jgi:hypothetical protein